MNSLRTSMLYVSPVALLIACQAGVLDFTPNDIIDEDGDGYSAEEDCDDQDAERNPGASEQEVGEADGIDNDCSGYADDVVVCEDDFDYDSVQEAINGVPEDFLIRICPGTYPENLSISEKRLHLMGIEGADVTFIDGGSQGAALFVNRTSGDGITIEGLTFTNGQGDTGGAISCSRTHLNLMSSVLSSSHAASGGGLGATDCTVNITQTTFIENTAESMGGGAYLASSEGSITESLFENNESVEGGGLTLFESEVTIEGNEVTGNVATTTDEELWGPGSGGGGIWSYGDSDILNNSIHHNTSHYHGGALYILQSRPEIAGNQVFENISHEDGAGGYTNRSRAQVRDNVFKDNQAFDDAGGFRIYIGKMVVEDNTFEGNSARDDAGGMKLSHSSNTIRRNIFIGNVAGDAGGGLELDNETSDVVNCEFRDNRASRGAGIHSWRNEGTLTIRNSLFDGNHAESCGGAIQMDNNPHEVLLHQLEITDNTSSRDGAAVCTEKYYQDDEGTIAESALFRVTNSILSGNRAGDDGGAFYVKLGKMTLENVTAHDNSANDDGGGIALKSASSAVVVNSLITASGAEGIYVEELYDEDEIPSWGVTIRYSDVWGSTAENYQGLADPTGTEGNISAPPLYRDADGRDFNLRNSSPAVDAGDPSIQDKDGSISDMGATGGPGAI